MSSHANIQLGDPQQARIEDLSMTTQNALLKRMSKMERELRVWRVIGMTTMGCVALAISLGANQNPETPRVLKAKEFQLVDDDGNVRATLKSLGNGTQLRLQDGTGKSEIAIVANDSNAIVHLTNDNRINSATLEAYASGGSMGLSRKTGDGLAATHVVGGTEGTHVELQPLKGPKVQIPSE